MRRGTSMCESLHVFVRVLTGVWCGSELEARNPLCGPACRVFSPRLRETGRTWICCTSQYQNLGGGWPDVAAEARAAENAGRLRGRQVRTSGLGLEACWWPNLARGSLPSTPGETFAWERR